MNPLLEISFRVPFDKIQASDVEPAVDELLADGARRLDTTIASDRPLLALDKARVFYASPLTEPRLNHPESVAVASRPNAYAVP